MFNKMGQDWRLWCRLCGSNDGQHVNIFFKEQPSSIQLEAIIQKHFMISVREIDTIPTLICFDCLNFCLRLDDFSERSDRVDRMYKELLLTTSKMTDYDLHQIRSQYCAEEKVFNEIELTSLKKHNEDIEINGIAYCSDNFEPKIAKLQKSELETKQKQESHNMVNSFMSAETDPLFSEEQVKDEIKLPQKCAKSKSAQPQTKSSYRKKGIIASAKKLKDCKYFTCSVCNSVFESRFLVNQHKITMHPEQKIKRANGTFSPARIFLCEECGKTFCTKFQLKDHQITHSNETSYDCKICSKKFKSSQTLKAHEDTHNTTAYDCPFCGIKLNTKRTLNMHLVVHSDVKKFKCLYCGNEYKRSKSLKAHLILHTGLRPYSCPWCERTFTSGSNCRSHKKKTHPNELAELDAAGHVESTLLPKLDHLQKSSDQFGDSRIN